MKNIIKKSLILFLVLTIKACASNSLYVESLENYSSVEPKETLQAKIITNTIINDIEFKQNDIVNCTLNKVKKPTRGKRDAQLYFNVISYSQNNKTIELKTPLLVKYSLTADLKEKVKNISPSKAAKKTASTVGSYFVKGFSYGFSFVDGIIENQEGNRLKSGAKQVYDDSFLSMVEYGNEIEIKKEDKFYLIVKKQDDEEYTQEEEQEDTIKDIQEDKKDIENIGNRPIEVEVPNK